MTPPLCSQDIGGTPTLFGVASVINHISEIFAYFFSFKLITQMGHFKVRARAASARRRPPARPPPVQPPPLPRPQVLCLGLAGNVLRFLYISRLTDPWWVLPFEFVQGVTHAAVWAACCSYIAAHAPAGLRASAQGVLQGLHHGLGRGCGAVLGGLAVARWGTTRTFAGYGLLCGVALAGFAFLNFRAEPDAGDADPDEEARAVAEAGVLAPHGVPSNPMPRALSSSRLADLQHDSYGATQVRPAAPRPPRPAPPRLTARLPAEPLRRREPGRAGAAAGAAARQPVPVGGAGRRLQISAAAGRRAEPAARAEPGFSAATRRSRVLL